MKTIQATVVKHTGSHYLLAPLPRWELFPAVIRGKVRLEKSSATNPVAVGDRVECVVPDGMMASDFHLNAEGRADTAAVITRVLPRDNYVIRKSTNLSRQAHIIAANVRRAFIVVTLAFPEVKLPFLDRILVTCGVYGIPAVIVLNKVDLLDDFHAGMKEDFIRTYTDAGYEVMQVSARTGFGIDSLRSALSDGVNLLSGVSGVGKSSLIKALDPNLKPRVAEISLSHLQGRHTTTSYEMYPLCSGGYIIDTPGIRSFGLLELEKEEIYKYFPEMLRVSEDCRFTPCTHTHEPGCAVKQAVDSGEISAERYNSYLGMLEESSKYR